MPGRTQSGLQDDNRQGTRALKVSNTLEEPFGSITDDGVVMSAFLSISAAMNGGL